MRFLGLRGARAYLDGTDGHGDPRRRAFGQSAGKRALRRDVGAGARGRAETESGRFGAASGACSMPPRAVLAQHGGLETATGPVRELESVVGLR